MDWFNGFFLPIIKTFVFLLVVVSVIYFIGKPIIKSWKTKLKYYIKYKIFKKELDPKTVSWCISAIQKDMSHLAVKKFLYIKGMSVEKTNETLWVYRRIYKELKGGDKNVRNLRPDDSENKINEELPTI